MIAADVGTCDACDVRRCPFASGNGVHGKQEQGEQQEEEEEEEEEEEGEVG